MADDKVRVKDNETRHEYTITRARFESLPDAFTEVDKPAVDIYGVDVPPKHYIDLSSASTAYEGRTVAQLTEDLDGRNAERDADSQVAPEGRTKADIVAALVADDARTADASTNATTEES